MNEQNNDSTLICVHEERCDIFLCSMGAVKKFGFEMDEDVDRGELGANMIVRLWGVGMDDGSTSKTGQQRVGSDICM